MSVPRILLLAGSSPYDQTVGDIFLRELCSHYPRESLYRLVFVSRLPEPPPKDWIGFPVRYFQLPRQNGILQRLGRPFTHVTDFLHHWYDRNLRATVVASKVLRMVQEQRVDLVWVFPAGATLTYVTRKVICVLKTPFVVTVWDPPDYFAAHLRLNRINLRILQKDFANILLKAVRCGVASEGMKEEYENLYGTKCIIQIHGVDPRLRQAPAKGISKDGQIVIGHAGNWHGQQEWEALLSALTSVNWSIDGREVTVRVLGSHILVKTQGRTRIEYLGWRSQEETIKLLSDMDIMYLPYWFDKRFGVSVRLCFPNKLTAYLAAGRPVLFHGPEDSSPARFFRRFPAGVCCHSLEKSAIIECLHRLVNDRELYASAVQAGQRALDEELNQQVFLRRFAELIGIQEKDLPVSYKKMIEECD